MSEQWDADWWLEEVASDPAYREELIPLLIDLLHPQPERLYLDVGCGEGQAMRSLVAAGARVVGCDRNERLLARAAGSGPVVAALLPGLDWAADDAFDGAVLMVVLEHIEDHRLLFRELHRVVAPGGVVAIVSNHPAYTPPGAGPLVDPGDGEVSWRWGRYLEPGVSIEPGGRYNYTIHHRPLSELLSAAAAAGWALARLEERGVGAAAAARDPLLAAQRHIPRLLGVRLMNTGSP